MKRRQKFLSMRSNAAMWFTQLCGNSTWQRTMLSELISLDFVYTG
jgi:hypothetical protein